MSNTTMIITMAFVLAFYVFQGMRNKKRASKNIQLGLEFLAKNGETEGIITTASGLQYEVISRGAGDVHPGAKTKVKVHYQGSLIDGTVVDSSIKRGKPISFPLNRVIKGWQEGVQLMVEGDKFRFYIPSELAYGNKSMGKISSGSLIIFEVELIEIV